MARKVSFRPRNNIAPWECSDCGAKLKDRPRVILVDVWGKQEAEEQRAQTKVKSRRWFCDYYCVAAYAARITTRTVLPPRRN